MSGRIPVLVNRGGGTAAARGDRLSDEIAQAFGEAGLSIDLCLLDGCDIEDAASAVAEHPIVVVGGGDGTLGCAAGRLAGKGAAMGILPLGTRNHLARELGVPQDLGDAAKLIAGGARRAIDLGRVNGHAFVNNASIGLYPALVRGRDATRHAHGWPKWLATVPASVATLKRLRHHRLRLRAPEGEKEVATPMLFVGNGRYSLKGGHVGEREALDDGRLAVYAVGPRSRAGLVGFALRTLIGRADPAHDFAAMGDTASFEVRGRSRNLHVALDGEVLTLTMPLRFASEHRALTVIAPASAAA